VQVRGTTVLKLTGLLVIPVIIAIFYFVPGPTAGDSEMPLPGPPVPEDGVFNLDSYAINQDSLYQWFLPERLREISGLAATADDRLFTHDDELGVIYEIDPVAGGIVKIFTLGEVVRDDFEGIAAAGAFLYLVTSNGTLYRFREGADGESVNFETFQTPLSEICEVEGLTYVPSQQQLLLACKRFLDKDRAQRVSVYGWSIDQQSFSGPLFEVPEEELMDETGKKHFYPSGIVYRPESGTLFLVAARQRLILEFAMNGELISSMRLAKKKHHQVEGISFLSNGLLILADEAKNRRARLSLYAP
jgi:uncharacterized protein YjiK